MGIIVAFQGVHGAYSEEAVRQHFGDSAETMPCDTFQELFEAVESGRATHGMQPVENSLAGTVASSIELLLDFDLRIQAETIVRVRHQLLAASGTPLAQIARARSHPQALAQCSGYLKRHSIQPVAWFDTAGSARDLAASPEPGTASIAGALAAKLYGLEIVDSGIEDQESNYTRFFLLGKGDPEPGTYNKTSIVFAAPDQPGTLYHCLGEFSERGINLTKIESKPRRNKPWQYYFFVDFEGHFSEPACQAALLGLLRRAAMLKILGSYPATKPETEGEFH
ncbi:MAG TPA: prephenate dehydratase [Aggregatilineales bacterium]|nr:prephenate dehydratase [Aggregatilineales bacterium]